MCLLAAFLLDFGQFRADYRANFVGKTMLKKIFAGEFRNFWIFKNIFSVVERQKIKLKNCWKVGGVLRKRYKKAKNLENIETENIKNKHTWNTSFLVNSDQKSGKSANWKGQKTINSHRKDWSKNFEVNYSDTISKIPASK